jgi:putative PEP-CTERM system histidine kinase
VPNLTVASHALACAVFAGLVVLVLTRWRDRMQGSLLLVALGATLAWAAVVALDPAPEPSFQKLVAELAKSLAWLVFLGRALGARGLGFRSPWLRYGPPLLAAAAISAGLFTARTGEVIGPLTPERVLVLSVLTLGLVGFVLVEQAFRNTRASEHWAVKFVWIGVGALYAYDVALFSASYALGGIEPTMWAARGVAFAVAAPVLGLGIERVRGFEPQKLMSQQLAFYTGSVVVAGLYLLAVSIAGYYVRVLGGTWGGALQVILFFGALLAFAATMSSSTVRARLRVELAKHFLPYKYDYRTEWLDLTARLTRDSEGSSLAQRTVEAFRHMARAGAGGIWVRRDDALAPVAGALALNADAFEPADGEFCRFLERHEWIVDVAAARERRGRDVEVPVPAWLLGLEEAWLAIPLLHDGRAVALVVLGRPIGERMLTWEDLDLLRTAGRQAASYFALDLAADALARERQFAAFSRFSAFMMHDLSNILAQQRLIVENAGRHKHNPAFVDDAIDTIENTVRRMSRLLEQMKAGGAELPARRTTLDELCANAVRRLSDRDPRPELVVDAEGVSVQLAAERFEHVLEHVIRNAQDATPPGGSVTVRLAAEPDAAVIEVKDTGRGMDAEFVRERLFRPFDTTKGAKGMGIGAFQAREFIRAAGGDVKVSSAPGSGTSFVIRLPRV